MEQKKQPGESPERKTQQRKVSVFTKLGKDGEPCGPIAIDLNAVACVSLSKLTGDVIIITKNIPRKGTIVIAEGFSETVKTWEGVEEVLVFHGESRYSDKSIPIAVAAKDVLSIDVGRGSQRVLLNTVDETYILKDTFEKAVEIWNGFSK
ncbi:MAG: hypothetical protein MJZ81_11395 [Bacteroidales bacterium]|nr:hypothetical protein [Bacteroidales bacterium]